MIKKLYAIDESQQPVKGALFTFTAADGNQLAAADGGTSGSLSLDSELHIDLFQPGVHVTVTAPGYEAAGTDTYIIPDAWQFIMPKVPSMLPAVGLGALIAFGALALTKKAGNKKVSGFDFKNDVLPYVVPAAVVIGGYLVYDKIFGQTPEDKKRDQALTDDIANAAAQQPPRMLDSEIAATANALVEDLTYSHPFGDGDQQLDAAHQLTKPGTTADLLRLIKQYGKHMITYFGIPAGEFTLEETVTRKLDADVIAEVNKYYQAQGISFQF